MSGRIIFTSGSRVVGVPDLEAGAHTESTASFGSLVWGRTERARAIREEEGRRQEHGSGEFFYSNRNFPLRLARERNGVVIQIMS